MHLTVVFAYLPSRFFVKHQGSCDTLDIVFVDDDNFQRELVKRELPEVVVTEFPKWPYMMTQHFSKIFKEFFCIEKLTDEDLNKTKQYKARIDSEEMKNQFDNIDDPQKQCC